MRKAIIRVWRGESASLRWLLSPVLLPLSVLYRFAITVREVLYAKRVLPVKEASVPVISVGNISVGGTGKTPTVEKIACWLKGEGFRPGIITRGYGRRRQGVFSVKVEKDRAVDVGDEAYMLARRTALPVLVGADRAEAISLGIREHGIDVAVLDDGFQRRDIRKDVEVLVLRGAENREARCLFPLGSYREPAARVKDAHMVIVNKGELDEEMRVLVGATPVFRMWYRPMHLVNVGENRIGPPAFLKEKKIAAFAGLGDNEAFFRMLAGLDARIVYRVEFADHHAYSQRDLDGFKAFKDVDLIVTTEKDAVKLEGLDVPGHLFYLTIEAEIEGPELFFGHLAKMVHSRMDAFQRH